MNSRTGWGIAIRGKIVTFVRENDGATTKQIRENVGTEAIGQIPRLLETGQLIRVRKGYYEFNSVQVKVN